MYREKKRREREREREKKTYNKTQTKLNKFSSDESKTRRDNDDKTTFVAPLRNKKKRRFA